MALLSRRQRSKHGFTITEMLIVVAIVGVLIAVAAPSLSSLFINSRLDTAANELMTVISFARSEAVRRGVNVSVERAAGGSTTRDWTPGWQVAVVGTGETLRIGQPLQQPVTLYNVSSSSLRIEFLPTGRRHEATDFVFVVCYDGALTGSSPQSRSRGVLVNAAGVVSLATTDANGRPLKPGAGFALTPITSCTSTI